MKQTEVLIASTEALKDDALFSRLLSCVSQERREKVLRLRCADERRRSLGAACLLSHALSTWGIFDYRIRYGAHGKPYLDGIDGVFFNLSHSGERVMCAISEREIGCDVERINPAIDLSLADRFFSEEEAAWVHAAESKDERINRFFRLWTLKESLMKATGEGFSRSLRTVSFSLASDPPTPVQPSVELRPYRFCELPASDGYRFSVCLHKDAELFVKQSSLIPLFFDS